MPQSGGDDDAPIATPGCNMSVGEDHVLPRPAGACDATKRTLIVMNNRGVGVGPLISGGHRRCDTLPGACAPGLGETVEKAGEISGSSLERTLLRQ